MRGERVLYRDGIGDDGEPIVVTHSTLPSVTSRVERLEVAGEMRGIRCSVGLRHRAPALRH
jgi:hypothetical protein